MGRRISNQATVEPVVFVLYQESLRNQNPDTHIDGKYYAIIDKNKAKDEKLSISLNYNDRWNVHLLMNKTKCQIKHEKIPENLNFTLFFLLQVD